ncbi:MAG: hypothetical protein OYH76_24500 [Defluviicoccus sp.]|nr:hypothetical protein [Defluviicoccus sp.]MDE0279069.1 hypothetical protein [Defluviicoccus sp.]
MLIRPMAGVAGAAALAAVLLPAPARAAEEVRIAAGRPGTPWHAFAVALARRYEAAVPGGKAVTIARGNGYWNPIVVNARRAEFGLSNAASAAWAYRGDETAYRKKKYTDIRAVMAGLQPVWIAAMLRVDYVRNTGHDTLDRALRAGRGAPRIVMEPFSSLVPIVADRILASMGSSRRIVRERRGDILQVGAAQIPSMIRGERADLYFEAVGPVRAAALGAALADHARFVDLPPAALAALTRTGAAAYSTALRPARRGRAVKTVDLGTVLIVHRNVGNRVVRAMLRVLIDDREVLARSHAEWRDYAPSPYEALKTRGVPMHPAAASFFRERGWTELAKRGRIPLPRRKPRR